MRDPAAARIRTRGLRAACVLLVVLGSVLPAGVPSIASDAATVSRADPPNPGELDVRKVTVTQTVDALTVTIRMRSPLLPRSLRKNGPNRFFAIFDVDGDGRGDYRARIVKRQRWLTALVRNIGDGDPGSRATIDSGLMLFRPNRRSVALRIDQDSALNGEGETGVVVRTRSRTNDRACRPCRDRAPNKGSLRTPEALRYDLQVLGSSSVPLGAPFRFRVTLTNITDASASLDLPLSVRPAGEPSSIKFAHHVVTVPADSSISFDGAVTTGQWFKATGPYQVHIAGVTMDPLSFDVTPALTTVPLFTDVTAPAGVTSEHATSTLCGAYAAGGAWGDADADGRLDLYLPRQAAPARLWMQQPDATFVESAPAAGVTNVGAKGMGSVFGDYDNDGDQDLYVVNDGPNRLYENDGTGVFTDVTAAAGVGDPGPGSSASWGDYDADGSLDLYVTNYFRCIGSKIHPFDDVLYHNNGDGTFTDVTPLLQAEGPTHGYGFQGAWTDVDADGDVDLYLANDHIGHPVANVLWRNDGPGGPLGWRFANASASSGTGAPMNAMGIGIGDYDGNLAVDLAVSNMGAAKLFRNDGSGRFMDHARGAGIARETQGGDTMSITWGVGFADFNNDSWEDLYVAAGSLKPFDPEPQPNAVYANAGDGTFFDLSAASGADDPGVSRGTAFADYDRDGRVDVYVVNQWGAPRLYRNVTPSTGGWLEVDLEGVVSNRDACGARVVAHLPGGSSLLREVHCGSVGLASGSDTVVHFGLGAADHAESLEIRWPSGVEQTVHHADIPLAGFVEVLEAVPAP